MIVSSFVVLLTQNLNFQVQTNISLRRNNDERDLRVDLNLFTNDLRVELNKYVMLDLMMLHNFNECWEESTEMFVGKNDSSARKF